MLALLLPAAGCDSTFIPFEENDTEFFALYGFLDTGADTQFVRVSPVRAEAATPDRIDAAVTTTDLASGTRVVWRDSVVVLDDGQIGHLFYAPVPVQAGARYRLEVARSDGRTTRAEVTVPAPAELQVEPVRQTLGGTFVQDVVWQGLAEQPDAAVVRYCVQPRGAEPASVSLAIEQDGERTAEGWQFTLDLTGHRFEVLQRLGRSPEDRTLVLCGLSMEIERLSPEWRTPRASANITGGFGFFGAVAQHEAAWALEADAVRLIGFAPPP